MRKDILEFMERIKKGGVKPNFSELGRRYNCDYRTVKKYYESDFSDIKERKKRPSKLDPYREIIQEKPSAKNYTYKVSNLKANGE